MKRNKQVAIMAVAQNIPQTIIDRFTKCIHCSKPSVSYDVHILQTKEQQKVFNKCKLLNKGIKKLTNIGYDVIIQTDVDNIPESGMIDKSYEVAMSGKVCFYNNMRRLTVPKNPWFPQDLPVDYDKIDWKRVMKEIRPEAANGAWNALQVKYFWETGGWPETMTNYGFEDDYWRQQSAKRCGISFLNYNKFCLIHINHPQRTKMNSRHNKTAGARAIKEGKWNWLT